MHDRRLRQPRAQRQLVLRKRDLVAEVTQAHSRLDLSWTVPRVRASCPVVWHHESEPTMDRYTARATVDIDTAKALGPAAFGFLSAMLVLFFTLRHQVNLDVLKDERGLRDAKRERLRADFETVLLAARTIAYAAQRRRYLLEGETTTGRDKEILTALRDVFTDIERARVRLVLERGTGPVLQAFTETYGAFLNLQLLSNDRLASPGSVRVEEVTAAEQQIQAGTADIERVMRQTLAALEQPIKPDGLKAVLWHRTAADQEA